MSPEQLRADALDARTDLFFFRGGALRDGQRAAGLSRRHVRGDRPAPSSRRRHARYPADPLDTSSRCSNASSPRCPRERSRVAVSERRRSSTRISRGSSAISMRPCRSRRSAMAAEYVRARTLKRAGRRSRALANVVLAVVAMAYTIIHIARGHPRRLPCLPFTQQEQ
jgi:hypothetical protein